MKKRNVLIVLSILILFTVFLFFRYGGEVLVAEDSIENVEDAVIMLLMGSTGDRALGAADLYKAGKANHIIIVYSHIAGSEALKERGISIPGNADISKDVLIQLGVAEEDITILPGDAESTIEEALIFANYAKKNPELDTILLVTSKFHSYRAQMIFNKALKDVDVTLYSAPTPYDPYEAKKWYRDREDIQRVVTEYMKLGHYIFWEQFQLR